MFLTLLLFYSVVIVNSEENTCSSVPEETVGKRLVPGIPMKPQIENIIGFQMCLKKCKAKSSCLSINYDRSQLQCELNEYKENESNLLVEDKMYIYAEIERSAQGGNPCGDEICNLYSTCVTTIENRKICIETDCAEPYPLLDNGVISDRTFEPISATYGCKPGFTGVGSVNRITCRPGGNWSALSYRCEPPVNGGWGIWGGWGTCSTTCGGGTKQRTRHCDNPVPMYGGSSCSGSSVGSTTCNTNGCSVNGGWGIWGGWGTCSVKCGDGTKQRTRHCDNPVPMYGGNSCSGSSVDSTSCNTCICDFESVSEFCFLTESINDDFNWIRNTGETNTGSTGPSGARVGIYYKYTEASSPRKPGDNAIMVSNMVFEAKTYCLSFYYHMYGSKMGTLKIQTLTGSQNPVTIWMVSGNQGNILIQGIIGSGYKSDIAIDYVRLLSSACP